VIGAIEVEERDRGGHVEAVAVRRSRRGRGVGTLLVRAAGDRWRPLSATFDASLRPFYEGLGFDVGPVERAVGVDGDDRGDGDTGDESHTDCDDTGDETPGDDGRDGSESSRHGGRRRYRGVLHEGFDERPAGLE